MLRRFIAVAAALVVFTTSAAVAVTRDTPPAGAAEHTCPASTIGGPQPSCVILTVTGSASKTIRIPADEIRDQGDSASPLEYPTCSNDGCQPLGPQYQSTPDGVPVRTLLETAGVAPEAVQTLTITGQNQSAYLYRSTNDLGLVTDTHPQYPFLSPPGEQLYPQVYTNGGANGDESVDYIRPQRSPGDPSYQDTRFTLAGQPLYMTAQVTGVTLHPEITPSGTIKVKPGHTVTFHASLPDGSPSGRTYSWTLDGINSKPVSTGSKPSVKKQYDTAGTYPVLLTVAAAYGSNGVSTQAIQVVVGSPPKKKPGSNNAPGNGAGQNHNPVNGPAHGRGLRPGAEPSNPKAGPLGPSHGAHSGQNGSGPSGAASATPNPGQTSKAKTGERPFDDAAFVRVNGILIDPTSQPLAAATPVPVQAGLPETAPSARQGTTAPWTLGLGTGLVAVVLALLSVGAFGESRRPTRRLARGHRR